MSSSPEKKAPVATTGITLEIWTELNMTAEKDLVTRFAVKLEKKHAHGQWLVCDLFSHELSRNPNFHGFQKIFRFKYKPTKFKLKHELILNSDNDTDSPAEIWGHAQKIIMEMCPEDVYVQHKKKEKKSRFGFGK